MASHKTGTGEEASQFLSDFLLNIRRHPFFSDCWIVFCCERNTAHESHFLAEVAKKFKPIHLYTENINNPDDYGKRTTAASKLNEVRALQRFLATSIPSAGFVDNWVACNFLLPTRKTPAQLQSIMKEKLVDQMTRYNIQESAASQKGGVVRYTVSGKVDCDGNASIHYKDDLMVAFAMNAGLHDEILNRNIELRRLFLGKRKKKD